ncbi:MAG TPA: nuclear transport factor 2 family protein [Edaphobacter sp.]|jgi:hypothetical protein|nr:nuclear transport factor 2 family protein [Edaphobacter sp.]
MQIADHLKALEESLLDPANRRNPAFVSTLLTDDFLEFGSSGRTFDKAAILEDLRNEPPHPAARLSDFAIRPLTPEVMLVTYRTTRHDSSGHIIHQAQRSSIWTNRDNRWQITFHQGTPIPLK